MRAVRGTDGAAEVCDRREGQTAQPAGLSREQHEGGAGWHEPRRNTQPERRERPCMSLAVRWAGRFPSRARNGAEAGGLRSTLAWQWVVVGCGIHVSWSLVGATFFSFISFSICHLAALVSYSLLRYMIKCIRLY